MSNIRMPKSSVVIGRLLASEGFSDHVQNAVEKYFRGQAYRRSKNERRFRDYERKWTEIAKKLDESEKLILGKFISTHKAQSFEIGLRIGISCFARSHDKEYSFGFPDQEIETLKQSDALPPSAEAKSPKNEK